MAGERLSTAPDIWDINKLMPAGRAGYSAVRAYLNLPSSDRPSACAKAIATLAYYDEIGQLQPPLEPEMSEAVQRSKGRLHDERHVDTVDALMCAVFEHGYRSDR